MTWQAVDHLLTVAMVGDDTILYANSLCSKTGNGAPVFSHSSALVISRGLIDVDWPVLQSKT
ncbi:hypothetical protein PSENEW3_00000512 [Picochlorum sp. SENEW3]|nr:hypothetical protein PSENEW3_00000512 [Picochlorum sp. SENEW3]